MKLDLAITGAGMLSAVGLSAPQCMHSIRSGISRMAMEPLQDRARQWIVAGRVPMWTPYARTRHLQALCETALQQAWRMATAHAVFARPRLGLVLASPDAARPGYAFPQPAGVETWIDSQRLGDIRHMEIMPAGASSSQLALHRAGQLLQDGVVDAVLIGAADTQAQFRVVRWHESHMRLKCSYVNDGLMPAEGAAMLVVESARAASTRGARALARVLSVAAAADQATPISDQPVTGQALTRAVAAALADSGVTAREIGMVWSDLNGESARAREWAYCEIRNRFEDGTELLHPADCQGDIGAATDAGLLALATWCHASGWSGGAPCMVVSSSDGGTRAAAVLARGDSWPELLVSRGVPRAMAEPVPTSVETKGHPDALRASFDWQVREEHRDELASLHYQRISLQRAEELPWRRVREPEQRMLNHLDAVYADGKAAMETLREAAFADEEGLCFAAALLVGTLGREADFAFITAALQDAPAARLAGVGHGIAQAPAGSGSREWLQTLARLPDPALRRLAAEVAQAQQVDLEERWDSLLCDEDATVATAAARACAQMPSRARQAALQELVRRGSPTARRDAMLALLLVDPALVRAFCLRWLEADFEFGGALSLCLGVCGHTEDAEPLLQRVQAAEPDVHAIEALGILGSPGTTGALADLLGGPSEPVRAAARDALELMCGALPSEPCVPLTAKRQRRGKPHSPLACLREIEDGASKAGQRQRAGMELQVALGVHVPFHTGWFVARQETAIARWQRLIAAKQ